MVALIGSSIACQAIEYEAGVNAKHLAWGGKEDNEQYHECILSVILTISC